MLVINELPKKQENFSDISKTILGILDQILIPVLRNNNGKNEQNYKCPLHEDKENNPKHGHLYINVNPKQKNFLNYYCFYCNTKGKNILKFVEYILTTYEKRKYWIKELSKEKQEKILQELNYLFQKFFLDAVDGKNQKHVFNGQHELQTNVEEKIKQIENREKQISQIKQFYLETKHILSKYNCFNTQRNKSIQKEFLKYLVVDRSFDAKYVKELFEKGIFIPFFSPYQVLISRNFFTIKKIAGKYLIFDSYQLNKDSELTDIIFFQQRNLNYKESNQNQGDFANQLSKKYKYLNILPEEKFKKDLFATAPIFSNYFEFSGKYDLQKTTLFLVEGIFDLLKLNYFLKLQNMKSLIIQMNRKVITDNQTLKRIMDTFSPSLIIYQPDKDVIEKPNEQKKLLRQIIKIVEENCQIQGSLCKFQIQIQTQFKDFGEINNVQDLKTVKIVDQSLYLSNIYFFLELLKQNKINFQQESLDKLSL